MFFLKTELTEDVRELESRLDRMEDVLKKAKGFRMRSAYGTQLEIGIRPFGERQWFKDTGFIDQPGKWDNIPGGEIFTTPDESSVNGVLVLPVLDSTIIKEQGVDELVRVTIRNGIISSIQGGRSAEIMRKKLEQEALTEIKGEENPPLNVYRIAELSFGANSKARSAVRDPGQAYDSPAVSIVEAEKRFGTMHIAFGTSKHGEEGTEGFEDSISHYDFVIPRNGLTVEMFETEDDFRKKTNGRKIISEGNLHFFD